MTPRFSASLIAINGRLLFRPVSRILLARSCFHLDSQRGVRYLTGDIDDMDGSHSSISFRKRRQVQCNVGHSHRNATGNASRHGNRRQGEFIAAQRGRERRLAFGSYGGPE